MCVCVCVCVCVRARARARAFLKTFITIKSCLARSLLARIRVMATCKELSTRQAYNYAIPLTRKFHVLTTSVESSGKTKPQTNKIAVTLSIRFSGKNLKSLSSFVDHNYCFTSTEARLLIRDGDGAGGWAPHPHPPVPVPNKQPRWGRGRKSEDSTADTARKRPERSWTAARIMEMLK